MNAWMLAKKDLAVYFRDKAGLGLGIGLPVVLATVFGMAMGAVGGGGDNAIGGVRIYVEDRDGSAQSAELLQALKDSSSLRVRVVDTQDPEAETAREHVADGDGPAGLLIPSGYGAVLGRGELPSLQLFCDPGKAVEQQIVAGSLIPILLDAVGDSLAQRAMHQSLDWMDFPESARGSARTLMDETWERMNELAAGAVSEATGQEDDEAGGSGGLSFDLGATLETVMGVDIEDVVGGDDANRAEKLGAQAHAVAGIAVMMLLFGLTACGGTLLDEQAEGTLDRLRLAPGASRSILAGKFLFTWVVGLLQLAILFLYGNFLFDIPIFQAPLAVFVLSCAVASAATGFGILFAVLCRTRKQLEGISTIVILSMSAMGGSWWPLAMTPAWYQDLAHFTLTAWAMDGYQGLFWFGKGLMDILPEIGVLFGIGAGTAGLALFLWRRRELA